MKLRFPVLHPRQAVLLIALVLYAVALSGCATDSENLSGRPWNSPQTWENGLPSSMTEGR